jgi:Mrp family chromosome partitioning ATPase
MRLDLVSYGQQHRRAVTAAERTRETTMYRSFSKNYNAVVIDGSGLLGQHELSVTLEQAEAILLVVEHGEGLKQEVRSAADVLAAMSGVPVGLVVTQAEPRSIPHDQFLSGVVLADDTTTAE